MEGSRADWSGSSSVSSPRTGQVPVTLSPPGHRLDRGNGHAGSVGGRPSRRTAKKRGRWWGQPQADAARGADLAPQWLPGCVGPLVRRRQRESERGADGLWRRVSSQMERRCRESELLAVVCPLVCRVGACLISNPLMCETFYALSSVVSAHRRFHSLCDPTRPDPTRRGGESRTLLRDCGTAGLRDCVGAGAGADVDADTEDMDAAERAPWAADSEVSAGMPTETRQTITARGSVPRA